MIAKYRRNSDHPVWLPHFTGLFAEGSSFTDACSAGVESFLPGSFGFSVIDFSTSTY
jgi:hypothetical protein